MFSTLLSLAAEVAEALLMVAVVAQVGAARVDTDVTCPEKAAAEVLLLNLTLRLL
jgi:hypothetical protein